MRVAEVIGAHLSIVTIEEPGRFACTLDTAFTGGAGVVIVATASLRRMDTAQIRVTGIGGAWVAIVTAADVGSPTFSVDTEIGDGARVAVVARSLVQGELTPRFTIADIVSAGIAIVAFNSCPDTFTTAAVVGHSARVGVVTGALVEGFIDTAIGPGTTVGRAQIAVIAGLLINLTITVVVQSIADIF